MDFETYALLKNHIDKLSEEITELKENSTSGVVELYVYKDDNGNYELDISEDVTFNELAEVSYTNVLRLYTDECGVHHLNNQTEEGANLIFTSFGCDNHGSKMILDIITIHEDLSIDVETINLEDKLEENTIKEIIFTVKTDNTIEVNGYSYTYTLTDEGYYRIDVPMSVTKFRPICDIMTKHCKVSVYADNEVDDCQMRYYNLSYRTKFWGLPGDEVTNFIIPYGNDKGIYVKGVPQ